MAGFTIQRTMNAPLKRVWDLSDFVKSVGISQVEVRNQGDPSNNNVGFTRAIKSGNRIVVEQLLFVDPMNRYTYTLTEGAPVKEDYLGVVAFSEDCGSTKLTWSATFTPAIPGTGWICALVIKSAVKKIIDSIEAALVSSSVET